MIGYGCNAAPWYSPDSRCPGRQGFHHGIDVAMPCGTRLYSAVRGIVLDPATSGTPGAAYGRDAFRIRSGAFDILIGHSRPPRVRPGDRVRPGQPIARASDSAAPDGCHLHFEVRRAGGGVTAAVDPSELLRLR
jgi:murein DD-endopeptidase MepM/ murein hydrolase activator NlpD